MKNKWQIVTDKVNFFFKYKNKVTHKVYFKISANWFVITVLYRTILEYVSK